MSISSRRLSCATTQRTASFDMNTRGPISFPDLATARQHLKTPADANYVMWDPSWPVDRDLEDVYTNEVTGTNDIVVLSERDETAMLSYPKIYELLAFNELLLYA